MVGLDIQLASFILLLLTAILSIQTQIFQVRTSIRESIEQLDEHMVSHSRIKLKPILHRFTYRGRWSETVIHIKGRRQKDHPYGISESFSSSPLWWLRGSEDRLYLAFENLDSIQEARIVDYGQTKALELVIQTSNPVEARRKVEIAIQIIELSFENRQ